ncbi:hypothetical protein ACFFR3_29890 [Nonomuraea salmonea]|uniref:Uncharacterized protein n=1 Tax=Nonomuraea salmonea TaxID=46181 RepID=A0ABV5NTR3_9ACTN
MFTPLRKLARPATHALLTVALAATAAPASADSDHDKFRKLRKIHSDRGFHTTRTDEDGGRNCRPRTFWRIHQQSPRNFFIPRTRFIDGPGGSITVSVTREHEVVAFLEAENEKEKTLRKQRDRPRDDQGADAGADVVIDPVNAPGDPTGTDPANGTATDTAVSTGTDTKAVVESIRRLGLPHLQERHKVFSGHDYTREISDGMYGNMWYRVLGYRIGWSAWSVLATCDRRKVSSGIANVPSRVEGWRYWETKHPKFRGRLLSWK